MPTPTRLLALALTVVVASSCAVLRDIAATATRPRASAKSSKDIAACEKMCEVAGDAENNKAAVDRCKADCRE